MKQENKTCFIVTPIGEVSSAERRNTDGLISSVLKPVLQEDFNFKDVEAAHEINSSGSINNQIMKRILYDDLVIANLTGVNPNVMYELAVRHATMKPIIHICENGTKLPFDIIDQRTIFYFNDMLGVKELRSNLTKMIKAALSNHEFLDNPIYNASRSKIFEENIFKDSEKNFEQFLLQKLERLESKLGNFASPKTFNAEFAYSKEIFLYINFFGKTRMNFLSNELSSSLKAYGLTLTSMHLRMEEEKVDSMVSLSVESNIPFSFGDVRRILSGLKSENFKIVEISEIPPPPSKK
ncbi:hypothetical protein FHG64_11490 [Antarcticibacterium flavum]|uniref:Uncharacterized protein n=1 Tax=Antarcticibacterium flavum TaxID=2058175 RepID=A0A5B7X5I8_9FLAO|nr:MULTISPECIES: hypothetical protein [Antarcticibacterium]MCM4159386.1 hypothetical protein [Antarcticibacterium sp. W02-3]QCY69972.1 hypothetical protein FHG64_11490 [Antarcticibacterium flavum]